MRSGKKGIIRIFVLCIFTICILAGTVFAGPAGILVADEVNFRSSPSTSESESYVIGVLYKDDLVHILTHIDPFSVNGFYRVNVARCSDSSLIGKEGWVAKQYLYVPRPE